MLHLSFLFPGERPRQRTVAGVDLDGAREGKLGDLENLVLKITSLPDKLVSQAFDVFLFHLDGSRFNFEEGKEKNRETWTDIHFCRAYISLEGVFTTVADGANPSKPSKPALVRHLIGKWNTIVKTILTMYEEAPRSITTNLALMTTELLKIIFSKAAIKSTTNEDSYALYCAIWFRETRQEIYYGCAHAMLKDDRKGFLKYVLKTGKAHRFADLTIGRIQEALEKDRSRMRMLDFLTASLIMLTEFAFSLQPEIAQVIVDCKPNKMALKILRFLVRHQDDLPTDSFTLTLAISGIRLLRESFVSKLGSLQYSIHRELIKTLVKLMPWLSPAMKIKEFGLMRVAVKRFLVEDIAGRLLDIRYVRVVGDAMKGLTSEDRLKMAESELGEDWYNLQLLVMERYVTFKSCAIERKLRRCDVVSQASA